MAGTYARNVKNVLEHDYRHIRKLLGKGSKFQAHHVFQDAVMRAQFSGYDKMLGFAVPLLSRTKGNKAFASPHYCSSILQNLNKGKKDQRFLAFAALRAAGCRKKDATDITKAANTLNEMWGWF